MGRQRQHVDTGESGQRAVEGDDPPDLGMVGGGGGAGGCTRLLLSAGSGKVAELAFPTTSSTGTLMRVIDGTEITSDSALSTRNTGLYGGEREKRDKQFTNCT
ncbi:hypothetical protein CIHG_08293 [Coccidioides immitis H538.4]|uniref:Uncharacterized protein n=1 Tax=Coccidioides immitis H538.4 TaxID=396776 RepID=A0A0J8S0F2_COCIT|nr:hypothetical protein CIHG_08293 [Coccidioides immitis H538.4]